MKRLIKYLAVMFTAALLCLTLFACGAEGTKYDYKEAKVEGDEGDMSSVTTMYDTLYKDSYIEVGDGEISWTMKDVEQKMTYEKDGDKYILGGEYMDAIKNSLSMGIDGVNVEISIWGAETEEGFKIVIDEKVEDSTVSFSLNFTKA